MCPQLQILGKMVDHKSSHPQGEFYGSYSMLYIPHVVSFQTDTLAQSTLSGN